MPVDPNVFNNIKNYQDYANAQQDFDLRKAVAQQQLQSGGIDAATKQNILATQLLSAATDQPSYDAAKAKLAQVGIDSSQFAPDFATGAQQVSQARLAQSPLGTLFGAQQKIISNNIAGTAAMGSTTGAAQSGFLQPVPSIGPNGQITITPQVVQSPQAAVSQLPNNVPAAPGQLPRGVDTPTQTPAVGVSAAPASLDGVLAASQTPAAPIASFSPPAQQAGETISAYNQRVQQAFEQYKASPAYLTASGAASATGKAEADANVDAIKSDQINQRLQPNFQALRNINDQLPDNAYGIPPSVKEWLSSANPLGDQQWANAGGLWKAVNEQQVLSALGQLVAGGQIRSNKQIASMLQTGNFVPENIPADGRMLLINTLANESKNQAVSAGNIAAQLNGGQIQPYQPTVPATGVVHASTMSPSAAQNLPMWAPNNPALAAAPSGTQFLGSDGNLRTKN